ncbi:MAG TPA: YfiR family protein [Bacteroidales bacterium]|nr:YfiR family protein [Bacteroidales bacterium]
MKKTLFILLVLFLYKANVATAQNEKFKALFMYNFTKYLEWPEGDRQGDFVITVLGDSKIVDELKIIAQKKKVGFQTIVVKQVQNPDQITKSHMLYIAENKSNQINTVKARLATSSTVIIADEANAISKGAGINYIVQGGKPLFEISKSNLEEHNVKVGADLLSLGIQK